MFYFVFLLTIAVIIGNSYIIKGFDEDFLAPRITKYEKGIAAILIVIHHLSQKIEVFGPFVIIRYIGFILVAIFFFISGYGLTYGVQNKPDYLNSFLRKRILPILIPYWIVNSINIIFYLLKGVVFTPLQYVLSYLGFDFITGVWFVTVILLMYIFFWIAFRSKRSYLIFSLCIIGYCIICVSFNLHSSYTASIAAFVLGSVWHKIEKPIVTWIRRNYYVKLLTCVAVFGIVFLGRLMLATKGLNNEILQFVLRNLISILFVICVLVVTQKVRFKGKILVWLGNISYELYMVHFVLFTMINNLEPDRYIIIVLGGGLLLSTLLWKLDKRIIKNILG